MTKQAARPVPSRERILVVSHGHPDFNLGGGEIAAYNLFKAYQKDPLVEEAFFLARADRQRGATGAIRMRRANEFLWEQSVHDWHSMKAANQESLTTWFPDLIRAIGPTIVHTHHYAHMGLEYIRIIREMLPKAKIVLTLHEYMAICLNHGQMVKTNSTKLCSRESFDECQRCFPEKSAEDFWLRKNYFLNHFSYVDHFIAPSNFLKQRYVEWGLQPEKITVIENGQADDSILPARSILDGELRNRFGFFGQITPFKGLDVVMEGLVNLPKKKRKSIVLEVHGANLENQPAHFREKIEALRKPLVDQGVVQWIGPYQPHELRARMTGVDWVVVPSIWWENSPMVIQEAFVLGRPLLVSDIGGMKEKVTNMVNGIHVPAGNSGAWAQSMVSAAVSALWADYSAGIQRPKNFAECASEHLLLLQQYKSGAS